MLRPPKEFIDLSRWKFYQQKIKLRHGECNKAFPISFWRFLRPRMSVKTNVDVSKKIPKKGNFIDVESPAVWSHIGKPIERFWWRNQLSVSTGIDVCWFIWKNLSNFTLIFVFRHRLPTGLAAEFAHFACWDNDVIIEAVIVSWEATRMIWRVNCEYFGSLIRCCCSFLQAILIFIRLSFEKQPEESFRMFDLEKKQKIIRNQSYSCFSEELLSCYEVCSFWIRKSKPKIYQTYNRLLVGAVFNAGVAFVVDGACAEHLSSFVLLRAEV